MCRESVLEMGALEVLEKLYIETLMMPPLSEQNERVVIHLMCEVGPR